MIIKALVPFDYEPVSIKLYFITGNVKYIHVRIYNHCLINEDL